MNQAVITHLEKAIENLKQTTSGFRADPTSLEDVLAKFEAAFEDLRGLQPQEADSPGRREARDIGFKDETPAPTEDAAPIEKTDDAPRTFSEAREVARERLSASAG